MQTFNKLPINYIHETDSNKLNMFHGWEKLLSDIISNYQHASNGNQPFQVILDGTHGAPFDAFVSKLNDACSQAGIPCSSFYTGQFTKTEDELREQFARYLTDNRAFGYVAADVKPSDYFRAEAKHELAQKLQMDAQKGGIQLVYGPGALWLNDYSYDLTYYVDYSRELQQRRHKEGMGNFGFEVTKDSVVAYKTAYFLEWPVWETYRREWLSKCAQEDANNVFYMDLNRENDPVWMSIADLNCMLQAAAKQPFRVKPFFAPGIWGGQYLKELCDLPTEWANCAWSFEPIAPENTILLSMGQGYIEVPFPLLLEAEPEAVMGSRNVELFGDYFPIRFDYLDTIGGSNLSLQVHPRQEYAENVFNQHMTQQESYYIMEQKPDAKVYLGLQNGVSGQQLLDAVDASHAQQVPLDMNAYVSEWTANKGDLYLIPPGTVHCSGSGNMVLEISSTTWWFTFKIYDYLRLDADGLPRPINRDHASQNINDEMNETAAKKGMIQQPVVHKTQGANHEDIIGHRDDLLFQVRRLHLKDSWIDDTAGEFVMYNLVEGQRVRLVPESNEAAAVEWGYAEAYIVPASVGRYRLESVNGEPCTLVRANVSPDWDTPLLPHNWHPRKG
ncbi:class I mannose-6-phosphate isomerase [Paenibacillus marinisediminis]